MHFLSRNKNVHTLMDIHLSCASVQRRHGLHIQILQRNYRFTVQAERQRQLQQCARFVVCHLLRLCFETIMDVCAVWHLRRILDDMMPIGNIWNIARQWIGKNCYNDEESLIKWAVNHEKQALTLPLPVYTALAMQRLFIAQETSQTSSPKNEINIELIMYYYKQVQLEDFAENENIALKEQLHYTYIFAERHKPCLWVLKPCGPRFVWRIITDTCVHPHILQRT